ncbi:hypothetical protein [Acanthopleuribacter pedis]|uniref:Uncharacterized protein n=1 Tax=Acanthopleuribacter pedis TaxID=442870 RepID=A0A8J7Q8F8_9BACT|nr:hypothetical protein [Acanthopleuribacter pedis]MBO1318799.1 hypothetical protein [Acanthopleuribacter pedis]
MRFCRLGLCLLFFALLPLQATTVAAVNVADLSKTATHIFEGRCLEIEHITVKDSRGEVDLPAVRYTFEILDSLKGKQSQTFVFQQLGNAVNGVHFPISADKIGVPKYSKGETYLIFLGGLSKSGLCLPVGLAQGLFVIREQEAYNGFSNAHIFAEMKASDQNSPHQSLILAAQQTPLPSSGKRAEGISATALKAMVRDLVRGAFTAPTRLGGDQ